MDLFSDVYSKCITVAGGGSFDSSWSDVETKLKGLLAPGGPADGKHAVLDEIRKRLKAAGKGKAKADEAAADEILKAAKSGTVGFQDRAALLKTMRHLYFVIKKGNQKVWVVDGPKGYAKWSFDLFTGKSAPDLGALLRDEKETFGHSRRKMMSDALQLARKWATDVQTKLASPDAKTLKIVQRWFHVAGAPAADVAATAATLHEGFKKIAATCNSTSVIFSDRPHKRTSGSYDTTYASVNAGDAMPVVYIFKQFLKAGRRNILGHISKLWLCALTVIHELSHKKVATDDIRYDDDGLKPGAGFTTAQALNNADSWAYFAADVVGALPKGARKHAYV